MAKVKVLRQQNLNRWHIAPANYSGITPLGSNRYAVVDDKSTTDGFHIFTIDIHPRNGKVLRVSSTPLLGNPNTNARADCEDIIYYSPRNTLFIAQERTGIVAEYHLDGRPTGRQLSLPPYFSLDSMQHNGAFEALAYCNSTCTFYLTTEQPLKGDSIHRIVVFDSTLQVCKTLNYSMDAPKFKQDTKYYAHGIAAMTVKPDGKLLVMERELSIPPRYVGGKCRIKVYEIPLHSPSKIEGVDATQTGAYDSPSKRLLFSFTTHISRLNYANYEGMCLGPTLDDGRQTLIIINDSQGGVRNGPFHLKDYLKVVILDH
ncbi:MAG: esterase-like activity of phytase family protein [Bacteroidaceae bacterium]|nr:esterase-like activity of phytase family protein [Bacteroidaceae bacterium]